MLGYFDGVHLGHRSLLTAAMKEKENFGGGITALSFLSLPKKEVITSPELKAMWLCHFGADSVIFAEFEKIKELSPEEFVIKILKERLMTSVAVCGYNYHFGKGGTADSSELYRLCEKHGIMCRIENKVTVLSDGKVLPVSSTLLRKYISGGQLDKAYSLSGHHFAVCEEVIHGRQFGRSVGLPTANQLPRDGFLLPPDGVYATYCKIDGKYYPAVTNLGKRPTFFGEGKRNSETHILGFSGDLYGKKLAVGFISLIRGEKKFGSADELVAEAERNKITAENIFIQNKDRLCLHDSEDISVTLL